LITHGCKQLNSQGSYHGGLFAPPHNAMIAGSTPQKDRQSERIPTMRPISYELYDSSDGSETITSRPGNALFLNISAGGMLLLMDHAPSVQQVMKLYVPTPVGQAKTPTLAEVRWTRPSPTAPSYGTYLVGVKFMI
jgi:hypothetical protein